METRGYGWFGDYALCLHNVYWFFGGGRGGGGLLIREPASSLFHDEKFAFFDFGVRGTPKMFAKSRPAPLRGAGNSPLRNQATPPLFSKIGGELLSKFSKFWRYP